jgi:hypothetical protein
MSASDHASGSSAPLPAATAPTHLPSLLQYVDHELPKTSASHNQPLHARSACNICYLSWDAPINTLDASTSSEPAVQTTFLPLSPCGHWVHYRCLIHAALRGYSTCNVCGTQLFAWEGITTLVLGMRTGLLMEDKVYDVESSDSRHYEEDCETVENLIHVLVGEYVARKSKFADGSADLVACWYNVCDALERMGRPRGRWLRQETKTGLLLWGMLVLVMMRRCLREKWWDVVGTEGWSEFERTGTWVQQRILEEVHRE